MLKKIRIKIETERYETSGITLTPNPPEVFRFPEEIPGEGEPERVELLTEARYRDDGERVSISYEEGSLSGMEGSTTTISFTKSEPELVSMSRTGAVKTALMFQTGTRHTCVYQTPLMPFEVCIATRNVQNSLHDGGVLSLDYLVELHGAEAEHTRFRMTLLPYFKDPIPQK